MTEDIKATLAARGGRYGDFRENGRITQNIKYAMRDSPAWAVMPPYMAEGFELMATKIGRALSGDPLYDDNIHDIVGYAKLLQDRMAQDREAGVQITLPLDPLYPSFNPSEGGVIEKIDIATLSHDPDARNWAEAFASTFPGEPLAQDVALMTGWFANAMMAMHDHLANNPEQMHNSIPSENETLTEAADGGKPDDDTTLSAGDDRR